MRVRARTHTNTHTHTHAKLHHLAEGLRRSFHPYTRKSWTHPTSAFPWLTLETKKIERWIYPASAFLLVTPGWKRWYHLQGGKGYGMWVIVGQFHMTRPSWFSRANLQNKTRDKKMRFHPVPNKNFCPTPPPLTQQQLMHSKKQKINKIVLTASPSSVFHTELITSVL